MLLFVFNKAKVIESRTTVDWRIAYFLSQTFVRVVSQVMAGPTHLKWFVGESE